MNNLTMSSKLYLLVLLSTLVLGAAMTFSLFENYRSAEAERKGGLAAMNDSAIAILKRYYELETSGTMTRDAAQSEAKKVIGAMRYGNGSGYFWINDMRPFMVMHPIKPEMNGTDLSQNKDPNGKFLFVEFTNVVRATGRGFSDYYWPKPGADQPVEKFSHVAGFEPWGWVVGTGVYSDDLKAVFWRNAMRSGAISTGGLLLLLVGAYVVIRSVANPIAGVRRVLQAIADGHSGIEVHGTDHRNEMGAMARALVVLRDSVDERAAMQRREIEQQRKLEEERRHNEEILRDAAEKQGKAMSELGRALEALANGDLTMSLSEIGTDYAKLRYDFNAAIEALNSTVKAISETGHVVYGSASDISAATNNLSRRTEQQAAALEETAAALDEITVTVAAASERAKEASKVVAETKTSADRSGEIVRNAIDAMGRIEDSSTKISQIIGVIDEIAFQTNLLALNAGVEAARAGEAGRGFAVVAQEVRELAQRSANAAREIKVLISSSTREVEAGVALVRSTGDALVEIVHLVERVNTYVDDIAKASGEQSNGLQAINSSVNQMDQMTQQNAAMVEEQTAASQTLANQSRHLQQLISGFQLGNERESRTRNAA